MSECRKAGYAFSQGMALKIVRGVAVAVIDRREPVAALVVASIRDRLTAAAVPAIAACLKKQKAIIERKLLQYHAGMAS